MRESKKSIGIMAEGSGNEEHHDVTILKKKLAKQ
jgi:hypothetical protein